MSPDSHDPIESAIDAVAREMTAAQPDAAFRARVLARIDEPRSVRRWRWVLSPAALAAIVLAYLLLHGRSVDQDARSQAAGVRTGRTAGIARTAPSMRQALPSASVVAAPVIDAPQRPAAIAQGTSAGDRNTSTAAAFPSAVDELAPPPIPADAIALDRLLRPEPLTIQPLEVPSIALAPIGDGDHQ